jgi:hypothetical protein
LATAWAHSPWRSCSRFSSSCEHASSVGCTLETWTGGSCFFPQLPYSSQEGHLRETWYPSPWLFRQPTGDNSHERQRPNSTLHPFNLYERSSVFRVLAGSAAPDHLHCFSKILFWGGKKKYPYRDCTKDWKIPTSLL